jgi:GcrA cell cycle regulator
MTFRATWTQAMDDELRAHWANQLSTAKIGEKMGLTKNAVVGRAHRLELPTRPSPILPRVATRPAVKPKVTLPPALPTMNAKPAPMRDSRPAMHGTAPPAPPPTAFQPIAARCCRWPLWNDKERPTHRYCEAPTTFRRDGVPDVYCAAHRAKSTARTVFPITYPRSAA